MGFKITWQEISPKAKDVQSATFSRVGSRSRSQIEVKKSRDFQLDRILIYLGWNNHHIETICRMQLMVMLGQGQGHRLRSKVNNDK